MEILIQVYKILETGFTSFAWDASTLRTPQDEQREYDRKNRDRQETTCHEGIAPRSVRVWYDAPLFSSGQQ